MAAARVLTKSFLVGLAGRVWRIDVARDLRKSRKSRE
jgi:hypothetical protein